MKILNRERITKMLQEKNCDPFAIMADICNNPEIDPPTRVRAASELAGFVAPKLKATELKMDLERRNASPVDLSKFRRPPKQISDVTDRVKADIKAANDREDDMKRPEEVEIDITPDFDDIPDMTF